MTVRTATQMRVLVLSLAAVVICAAALGVVQYRSLVQLEIRTRINFQDDLVRAAQTIAGDVEREVCREGASALSSFGAGDTTQNLPALAKRFQVIRDAHPEIDEIFLFAFDDPNGASAVFSNENGTDRCT